MRVEEWYFKQDIYLGIKVNIIMLEGDPLQQDSNRELSSEDCRAAGDCLIALEAKHHGTHALSTNASEWEPLSTLVGFEFVKIEYPEEKTR